MPRPYIEEGAYEGQKCWKYHSKENNKEKGPNKVKILAIHPEKIYAPQISKSA